jgi:hypothetical protein
MAYSHVAQQRRRCTGLRKDGLPCRAYAMWDDPIGRCNIHAGRGQRGPRTRPPKPMRRARYKPCTCPAYAWPHKRSGGGCNWPGPPKYPLTTPAGTRRRC